MKRYLLATTCVFALAGTAKAQSSNSAAPPSAQPVEVAAQTATSAGQSAPPTSTDSGGIQDIVVTAQRRSENLQRAAIAISAVSGATLAQAGVTKPTELTSVVPSLQVAPAAGPYALFYLRGVGNFNGNALSDSAVAFNFAGVYVGRPSSTTGFFYDLDRVEVVKGPQGTLYGRNATGGAINVIPQKPILGQTTGYINGEYGNYNTGQVDGALNIPIGDIAALRFAGTYVRHDGYMKDGTDDQNEGGGRISLLVDPTDNLKITVVGDYFRQGGEGVGATPQPLGIDNRDGVESARGQAFFESQPNVLIGNTLQPLTVKPFLHNYSWGVSSTIDWSTPIGTISFIPAHREGSLNYASTDPGFLIRSREKDSQNSFEARLASHEDHPFRYLVGLFYYQESNHVPEYLINQEANFNYQYYQADTKSMAAFTRLTYAITPALRLNVGARYTTEDKQFDGQLQSALNVCVRPSAYFPTYVPGCPTATGFPLTTMTTPAPNFIPGPDGTITLPGLIDHTGANAQHATFDKVTYRAGADWDITSRNLLYASFETGFKSGGFFFSADGGVYKPETIKAYTIGSKNRFFDNKLQINIEGFYWKYRNQQISHLSNDSQGNTIFATENVGRATFKGVEAEIVARPLSNTTLNADVQYLDAKYNQFTYTVPNTNGGVSNGTGCANVGTPGTFYTVNCSGNRPPNAPRWTLNLGAEQTIPLGEGKIVIDARAHYQTQTLTGLEFTQVEYQKSYWQGDAQVTYHSPHDRFTIGAFGDNLFNKTVISLSYPVPLTFFNVASLRPPRTYGVRAGFKF